NLAEKPARRVVRIRQPLLKDAGVLLRELESLHSIDRQAPARVENREDFGKPAHKLRVHWRRLPQEAVLRKPADVVRDDPPFADRVDEGDAVAAAGVVPEIVGGGDDCAQGGAVFEIEGMAKVERT